MSIPVAGSGTAFYINLYLTTQIGFNALLFKELSKEEVCSITCCTVYAYVHFTLAFCVLFACRQKGSSKAYPFVE